MKDLVCEKKITSVSLSVILSIFVCTRFVYTDFNIRQFIGYGFLAVFLILGLRRSIRLTHTKILFLCLVISTFVGLILPNYNNNKSNNAYMIVLLLFVLYFVLCDPDQGEMKVVLQIFQITAVIFAILIIFFRIFTNLYWSSIYKVLSDVTREEAWKYVRRGYGIPIGGEYPYANYVMTFGCLASFCKMYFIKNRRMKNLICAVITIAGLFMTGRRSEPIMLILVMLLLLFSFRRKRRNITIKKLSTIFASIIVIVLFVLLFSRTAFFTRITSTISGVIARMDKTGGLWSVLTDKKNDITSGRIILWELAYEAFRSHLIMGIGWGQFVNIIPDSFNASHGRAQVSNVHNDYLQHFCECGIFVGGLITVFTIWLLIRTWKDVRKAVSKNCSEMVKTFFAVSLGVQLFFAILGLIDPCFYNSSYWGFFTIAVILMSASEKYLIIDCI